MNIKEYIAIIIVLIFLLVLSETKIRIGGDKFNQLSCAAHLKKIYEAVHDTMAENSTVFADNPAKPWYSVIQNLKPKYLRCSVVEVSKKDEQTELPVCHYALESKIYEGFKKERNFYATTGRSIFLLDAQNDPTDYYLFPMVNPAFRHNAGCNILLMDGTVVWCDKDDFTGDAYFLSK